MAILMVNAVGMPLEAYDAVMADVARPLSQAPGFISHTAVVEGEGLTIAEVWESREQWRAWFDASVRPHLPAGAPEPRVVQLHRALGR